VISFQYRDKATAMHRLNPFCKLAWLCSVFFLALTLDNPLFLVLLFASTVPSVMVAGVWREWASLMKFALILCLFIIVINVLVNYNGNHVLAEAPFRIPAMGTPRITVEAIFYGIAMAIRLLAIVSAFAVVTFTVHPDDMMLSMIKLKLPYKSVLVTSLSTRFVPTLVNDMQRIADVQRSRGLELDRGRLVQRIRKRSSVILPLLSNSLDRTVQIAEAMESRAFGSGSKRTFYKDIQTSRIDLVTLALGLAPCGLAVFMLCRGYGGYRYYPTLGDLSLSTLEWSMLPILASLLSATALLALVKKRIDLD
jgi:energy-coupling factor transport system permease protein